MSKQLIILEKILGSYSRQGKEYLFYCPKCDHHKRKLSVNLDKGAFKCWICDFKGKSIMPIIEKYGTKTSIDVWRSLMTKKPIPKGLRAYLNKVIGGAPVLAPDITDIELPKEFETLIGDMEKPVGRKAKKYLLDRGLRESDIIFWKLGYCFSGEYHDRVIIPSFTQYGTCNYFVAREFSGKSSFNYFVPKDESKDIIFNEINIDWSKEIIVVEGVFDAIKAGPNSIPLLGSSLRDDSVLFKKIVDSGCDVYLSLDKDAQKKQLNIAKKLMGFGNRLFYVDVGEFNDVGEMTRAEFLKAKSEAKRIDTSFILKTKLRKTT